MRIVFFGTSLFAVPALEVLLSSSRHEVLGVVTQPDRPSGRGLRIQESAVKLAALSARPSIPILQPEKVRTREFREQIRKLGPEVLVVAAFGQILSQRLLDVPRFGAINIHGSLLPRWRGAAPMQYALMAGDTETGVTTMRMDAGMDTGDILLRSATPINALDTVETIEERLSAIGAQLITQTLERIALGSCPSEPQNTSEATYAPSLASDIGYLDWNKSARDLANLIRGVTPRPGAWAFFGGRRLKIWEVAHAELGEVAEGAAGSILPMKAGLSVACGDGTVLSIAAVQPEGKPRMSASDWARGARIQPGDRFEPKPET